jgi:hypothetical protein
MMPVKRSYHLFLIAACLLFIVSFWHRGQTVDIHQYDTYYVIGAELFYRGISLFFVLIWVIYKFTDKYLLTYYLTWGHMVFTFAVLLYSLTPGFQTYLHEVAPPSSFQELTIFYEQWTSRATMMAGVLIAGQVAVMLLPV